MGNEVLMRLRLLGVGAMTEWKDIVAIVVERFGLQLQVQQEPIPTWDIRTFSLFAGLPLVLTNVDARCGS